MTGGKGRRHGKAKPGTRGRKTGVNGYELRGHLWIEGPEGTFLGYGRVVLMERIREYGSITKAARSMDMSYRHAWDLIDSMNRQAPRPFVRTVTGGRGGGGTVVTEDGEWAIRLFWRLVENFTGYLEGEQRDIRFGREGASEHFLRY